MTHALTDLESGAETPTRDDRELETRLTAWFRGHGSVLIGFSGGVDSAYLACTAVDALGAGRVLAVIGRSASYPSEQWERAREVARQFGVPVLEVSTDEVNDPRYAANPSNRCYFCKTELWDTLAPIARDRGIVTLLDNTWATPLFFPAIAAGVDITILAATKYVGGHADVMLGSATATSEHYDRLQDTTWDFGQCVSPDDAWLVSRGLRTMAVRLEQHEKGAFKVAEWLKAQPQVGRVLHPALPDCPGHDLWKRDFKGSSGLFSFELKSVDAKARAAFVDRLELFGIGYSWGGYESLALPVDPHRTATKPPAPNLVRLHIGLEDADDLIADLGSSLGRIVG